MKYSNNQKFKIINCKKTEYLKVEFGLLPHWLKFWNNGLNNLAKKEISLRFQETWMLEKRLNKFMVARNMDVREKTENVYGCKKAGC